jgi:hypothetical protein
VTEPDQVSYLRSDVVIDRVNALTTTLLDTVGVLLVAFAAGWAIWGCPWRQSLAVGVTGAIIAGLSQLSQHRAVPRGVEEVPDEPRPLPGPSHPGTVHIAGR